MVQYTDKQKLAYYKKKSSMKGKSSNVKPSYSVSGSGDYKTVANRFYKNYKKPYRYPGAGAAIGGAIGGAFGRPALGSALGSGAHSLVKTVTGFGDYNVSQNSLVYNRDAVPEFSVNNERCTMLTHKEFITDVVGSTLFTKQEFRINPNIGTTFPWLSSIAENYEQYVVQGMIFEYKTTCATAIGSTNTALGTVVLATQYNSLSPPFQSKQQMENYEFAISSVPSQSIMHPIECDPNQTQCGGIFNMADPADASGDTRLYDIGRFTIATVGMQAASVIGELWVTYKICLLKPRLRTDDDESAVLFSNNPGTIISGLPFGTPANWLPINTAFDTKLITVLSGTTLSIMPGYLGVLCINIFWDMAGVGPNGNGPTTINFVGCVNVTQNLLSNTYTFPQILAAGGNGNMVQLIYVKCLGNLIQTIECLGFVSTASMQTCRILAISFPSEYIDYPYV